MKYDEDVVPYPISDGTGTKYVQFESRGSIYRNIYIFANSNEKKKKLHYVGGSMSIRSMSIPENLKCSPRRRLPSIDVTIYNPP